MADAGNNEPEPSSGSESTPSTTANPSIPEICREREVVSLLDRLRSPAARKLSVNSVNTPGNRRSQTSVSRKANEPMKVSASQRVQEFKEESLTSSTHMSQLIPFVLEEEYKSIFKEILGKELSIIFDGTTRDGEALAVLARFVQDWEVKVRLVRFQLVKSSVNGDELARIMFEVLDRKLNVAQGCALAAMRDRAPVNTKAFQTVSVLYPEMLDVGCISHFLDRVGTKCNIPVLKQFMTTWNLIFTTSMKGRRVWKEVSGKAMPRYNATRWWSYWECAKVVFEEWRHITTFLESNEEFADTSRQRLSQILRQNAVQLKVEIASLMELEKFVKARQPTL